MPKPIPPPPPQASAEETVLAVRLSRALFGVALALFFAVSPAFALDGWLVDHGRKHGLSWNLLRLQELPMDEERAHDGGRVVWLVGPSILRDAIDEEALNQHLVDAGAPLRAIKLGTDRGAPGIAAGIVDRLPLQDGDVVVVSASASNFRPNWLKFADMPTRFVTQTSSFSEFWQVQELSPRDRMEASINYAPSTFWSYREEAQLGASAFFRSPWLGWPKERTARFHTTFRAWDLHPEYTRGRLTKGTLRHRKQTKERWSVAPDQFNVRGLDRIAGTCAEAGVPLVLVDFPTTQLMYDELSTPHVREQWELFKAERGFVTFDRPPDDAFYDYMHTNAQGRDQYTRAMAELLSGL